MFVDVMLPQNYKDYDDLTLESIKSELKLRKWRNDKQLQLINRTLTDDELKEIDSISSNLLKMRTDIKEIQEKQKYMVSNVYNHGKSRKNIVMVSTCIYSVPLLCIQDKDKTKN